jgi:hypothetical protein
MAGSDFTVAGVGIEGGGRAMATVREIQETIARCVSVVVFYKNSEKTQRADQLMSEEVQTLAGQVRDLGLDIRKADDLILAPVERELLVRYGHEVAPRLYGKFAEAFDSVSTVV